MRLHGLAGRVAVVTGASGAIGQAVARALAGEGVAVTAVARRAAVLDRLVQAIVREGGRAVAMAADVTDRHAVERVREETERHHGLSTWSWRSQAAWANPSASWSWRPTAGAMRST